MVSMRWIAFALVIMSTHAQTLDEPTAERFANLALACVHREYPNKIGHVLNSDKDVLAPRQLTPAFYGCFDWHSSVHGHWMLARLARTFPKTPLAERARAALAVSLTRQNLENEAQYVAAEGRSGFERPYGLAWLLQLASELREWDDLQAKEWAANISPLENSAIARLQEWLRKLSHPVRSGEHSNTAFGLGLMLDSAGNHPEFAALLADRAKTFYGKDHGCPIAYEPSGEDFLSPCLAEADVMRRVLPAAEFGAWLGEFLPGIPRDGSVWLKPEVVTDPSDGKLAHLDGLNLSRAWMLNAIAMTLPAGDKRIKSLQATAAEHAQDGLRAVTGAHYEGGHWLGSFAVYLTTGVRR
jgi:hypothetical protein